MVNQKGPVSSVRIQTYFKDIKDRLEKVYTVAQKARAKGLDPEPKVDIPLAVSIADRVEALIGSTTPNIIGKGIPKRISELEKEYGPGDWRVALKIAEEIATEKFCKFDSQLKAIATGIRTGLAYTTQGVVSAPLEGLAEIKFRKRKDGKDYLSIYFGGPIRGAGGTQQAVSILIADYVRKKCNVAPYDPTPDEIKRYYVNGS